MRIVVDAMGSDKTPLPEVTGAVEATSFSKDLEVVLVGDEHELRSTLAAYPNHGSISIVHASQTIGMGESPVMAIRKKKDSSILVGLRLVKRGEADAFVSAGNTGAVMVGGRIVLGRLKGVSRSALCQMFPTEKNPVFFLDLGANVDCTARQLCDFAEMGTVYSKLALDVKDPRVGLLNIGEEQAKGNELAKKVHRYLSAAKQIRFIGNIEPKAMFRGRADVVVCDGFVGNVVLKTSEAVASLMTTLVKRELLSTPISTVGASLSQGAFKRLKKSTDANESPGAPLLGVNGVVFLQHGACNGRGIANAIQGARRAVESEVNEHIRIGIEALRNTEDRLDKQEAAN